MKTNMKLPVRHAAKPSQRSHRSQRLYVTSSHTPRHSKRKHTVVSRRQGTNPHICSPLVPPNHLLISSFSSSSSLNRYSPTHNVVCGTFGTSNKSHFSTTVSSADVNDAVSDAVQQLRDNQYHTMSTGQAVDVTIANDFLTFNQRATSQFHCTGMFSISLCLFVHLFSLNLLIC